MFGQEKLLKLLIDNGAEINYQAKDGTNALMHACGGEFSFVKLLVENGANVNAIDTEGKSALIYEVCGVIPPNFFTVEYLLLNGANANIKTNDGKSLLDFINQEMKELNEEMDKFSEFDQTVGKNALNEF